MTEAGEAGRRLELELPAAHESVRVGRNLVVRFARMGGVPSAELDCIRLVVSELLANAVDHGAGGGAMNDREALVRMGLVFRVEPASWVVEVTDQGGGSVETISPLLGQDIPDFENERGRGFFLLEQMLDSLLVRASADGRGLTMVGMHRFESEQK